MPRRRAVAVGGGGAAGAAVAGLLSTGAHAWFAGGLPAGAGPTSASLAGGLAWVVGVPLGATAGILVGSTAALLIDGRADPVVTAGAGIVSCALLIEGARIAGVDVHPWPAIVGLVVAAALGALPGIAAQARAAWRGIAE